MSDHYSLPGVDSFGRTRGHRHDEESRRSRDFHGGGPERFESDRFEEPPLSRHSYGGEYAGGVGGGGSLDASRGMKRSYESERSGPYDQRGGGDPYRPNYHRGNVSGEGVPGRYGPEAYDDRSPPRGGRDMDWPQQPLPPPHYREPMPGHGRDMMMDSREPRGDHGYGSGGGLSDDRSPAAARGTKRMGHHQQQHHHSREHSGRDYHPHHSSHQHHGHGHHQPHGGPQSPAKKQSARQGPVMSFKSYMQTQKEDFTPEVFQRMYEEYQMKYLEKFSDTFFENNLHEEWFQERYNPVKMQELELEAALWAAKESAVIATSARSHPVATFQAMSLDPTPADKGEPHSSTGSMGAELAAGSSVVTDHVAGRNFFGHENRTVYVTGIHASCPKKIFKAAVTDKLTSARLHSGDKDGETEFLSAPIRIAVAQPSWNSKFPDRFERCAWVVMPTAQEAQQALAVLSGMRIEAPDAQLSMSTAPFVETAPDQVAYISFTVEAKMHLPRLAIKMPDFMSHSSRIASDCAKAEQMAALLDEQREVPEESRLAAILSDSNVEAVLRGAPAAPVSYAQAVAAAAVDAISEDTEAAAAAAVCGPTARLDLAVGYLRRVHFVVYYGGKRFRDEAHLMTMAPSLLTRSLPYVPAPAGSDAELAVAPALAESAAIDADGNGDQTEAGSRKRKMSEGDDDDDDDDGGGGGAEDNAAVDTREGSRSERESEKEKEDNEDGADDGGSAAGAARGDEEADSSFDVHSSLSPQMARRYRQLQYSNKKVPLYDRRVETILHDLTNKKDLRNTRAAAAAAAEAEVRLAAAAAAAAAEVDKQTPTGDASSAGSASAAATDSVAQKSSAAEIAGVGAAAGAVKTDEVPLEVRAKAAAEAAAAAVPDSKGCNVDEDEANALFNAQNETLMDAIGKNCKIDPVGKKSRCCFVVCSKLFKSAEFLAKHMRAKHPTFMSDALNALAAPYMKRRFERSDLAMRPLPPVEVETHGTTELHSVRYIIDKCAAAKAPGGAAAMGPPGLSSQQQFQHRQQHPYAQQDYNRYLGGQQQRGGRGGRTSAGGGEDNRVGGRSRGHDARDRRSGGGGGDFGPPPGLSRHASNDRSGALSGPPAQPASSAPPPAVMQQPRSENNFARKMSSYLDVDAPKESAVSIDYGVALLPPVKRRRVVAKK